MAEMAGSAEHQLGITGKEGGAGIPARNNQHHGQECPCHLMPNWCSALPAHRPTNFKVKGTE